MKKEKKFFIPANNIKDLLTDWNEAGGCFASDRITVDGLPVGYMYREIPDGDFLLVMRMMSMQIILKI